MRLMVEILLEYHMPQPAEWCARLTRCFQGSRNRLSARGFA